MPVYAVNCDAEKNKRLCAEQVGSTLLEGNFYWLTRFREGRQWIPYSETLSPWQYPTADGLRFRRKDRNRLLLLGHAADSEAFR